MPTNFRIVEPGRLYRSGRINPNELRMLSGTPYKVKKIISLDRDAGALIAPYMSRYGIEHVFLPINLGGDIRTPANTIGTNAASLFTSRDGAVLVHCALGRDRTGFAIAMYNIVVKGRACDVAIREQKSLGYGLGLSPQAENQLNAELCRRCRVGHTHYCETVSDEGEEAPEVPEGIETTASQKDIRDLMDHERTLEGNPAIAVPPAHNDPAEMSQHSFGPQQSFAPFLDPNSDVAQSDDDGGCGSCIKARVKFLKRLLKLLKKNDSNDMDVPLVGDRPNYTGVPDSKLNPPSGSDGSVPGSNLSAGLDGGITQF